MDQSNANEKEDKTKKMTDREQYTPGPASGAQVRKDGEKWTLILVRELPHPPEKVWQALTDPAHLRKWAPFAADGSLGTVGTTVHPFSLRSVWELPRRTGPKQELHEPTRPRRGISTVGTTISGGNAKPGGAVCAGRGGFSAS